MADASIGWRRVSFRDYFCLPVLIILVVHLPYFPFLGVTRAIHYLVYPLFLYAFTLRFFGRSSTRPNWNRQVLTVVAFFIAMTCCYLFDAAAQWNRPYAPLHFREALSCCDFFFLNVAVYFCLAIFCRRSDAFQYQKTFRCCVDVLWGCLIFNTILVLIQNATGASSLLNFWVANRNDWSGLSVSSFGIATGRLSGIYFLPFRAGIQYALGLFLLIDRYKKQNGLTIYEYVVLAFLLIGATLAASKAVLVTFLIGGVYLFYRSRFSFKLACLFALVGVAFVAENVVRVAYLGSSSDARQSWYDNLVVRQPEPLDNAIDRITAGRFNVGGTVYQDMGKSLADYPLTGKGLGNNEYSIDSGYNFAIFAGGIPMFLLYVGLLGYLFFSAFRRRKERNPNVDLLTFLATFILLADFGAPTLMQHHFGPIFAVVYYLTWGTIISSERERNLKFILPDAFLEDEENKDENDEELALEEASR